MAERTKAKILLVDDDPIVRDSLGDLLAADGHDISTARNVAAATAALAATRFDLVITDVSMPTCDGFELLRHIRENHADIEVLLMTGYGMIESAVEAVKLGAYAYLTKPVIDDDVRTAVRRALTRQDILAENRSLRQALAVKQGYVPPVGFSVDGRDGHAAAGVYLPETNAALADAMAAVEKNLIQAALESNSQSRNRTAAQLGIDRTTLFKKMRRHGLLGR